MTSRRPGPAIIPQWIGITAVIVMLMPGTVWATHFELSRLASQIELISGQLAHELRYRRHYGPVRLRAVALEREASQLVDTLRRNRSNSRVSSQFREVQRGYERLESAFFNANRNAHDPYLFREINLLSDVFTNLSDEFYYAGIGGRNYNSPYVSPYIPARRGSIIVGSRNYGGIRHDSRQNGYIAPHRERAVPPVWRGNSGRAIPRGEGGSTNRGQSDAGPSHVGIRVQQRAPRYDHRSNVLERQRRLDQERGQIEHQSRSARGAANVRQSPARRDSPQGIRRGRGVVSETDSRNHYE
ncbi:MAG: hypothetical protein WDZ52_01935 [Pseudohongiellaceae bacterium]